jgi:hypothetical protein
MPVILATQEAEIRRIVVQGQANSSQDPTSKIFNTETGTSGILALGLFLWLFVLVWFGF